MMFIIGRIPLSTAVPERVEWYARRHGVNAVPPAREAYHKGISPLNRSANKICT